MGGINEDERNVSGRTGRITKQEWEGGWEKEVLSVEGELQRLRKQPQMKGSVPAGGGPRFFSSTKAEDRNGGGARRWGCTGRLGSEKISESKNYQEVSRGDRTGKIIGAGWGG